MINTLSGPMTSRSASPVRAQQQPAPTQPAPTQPAPAGDSIDLTTIDCPFKAVQLPAFNPAFQMGMALGVFAAMMGGSHSVPVTITLTSSVGNNITGVHAKSGDGQTPITAVGHNYIENGQVETQVDVNGKLSIDMQAKALKWEGKFGNNDEAYSFAPAGEGKEPSIHMTGNAGSVPVDLTFKMLGNINSGVKDLIGFQAAGTVGGLPYSVENKFHINDELTTGGMPQPKPNQLIDVGSMCSRGSLGDRAIATESKAIAMLHDNGTFELGISGGGQNAGVEQKAVTMLKTEASRLGL